MFLFYLLLIVVHTNWQEFFFLLVIALQATTALYSSKTCIFFTKICLIKGCPFVSNRLATYTTGDKIYVKQNCKMSSSQNTSALVCCIVSC